MIHVDLFSGIGGFALAARWVGWRTVQFVEIEEYPRRVLRHHWPEVPIHDDIRSFSPGADLRAAADDCILTGGFPCQPHSVAGKRRGRDDERYLWPEMRRVIEELRPRWVLAENVPGLRTTAADEVLADLETLDYACWPVVVGAVHAGAPHRRQRVWIVANAESNGLEHGLFEPGNGSERKHAAKDFVPAGDGTDAADAIGSDLRDESRRNGCELADRLEPGCAGTPEPGHDGAQGAAADADAARLEVRRGIGRDAEPQCASAERGRYQPDWRGWTDSPQPAVRRLDDGLPAWVAGCRVQSLKALGNAIVPQVAYEIFRVIEANR